MMIFRLVRFCRRRADDAPFFVPPSLMSSLPLKRKADDRSNPPPAPRRKTVFTTPTRAVSVFNLDDNVGHSRDTFFSHVENKVREDRTNMSMLSTSSKTENRNSPILNLLESYKIEKGTNDSEF
jgi:hypothetical protein